MAFIYKITNQINNKVYIGQTSFSIKKRWEEHIKDSQRPSIQNRPLYMAMNKYGIENFLIELVEETDCPNEREIYWIEQYNSYHNGYNATTGGEGRPYEFTIEEIELMIKLYNQNYSITDISAVLGHDTKTVRRKMLDLGLDISNHRTLNMAVYQLDKKTGAILQTFVSCHAAARSLNDDRKAAHIRECCRHLRQTAYGYRWCFVSEYTGV